jgi:organic hydroperoxide reductase OsmC/OhrA
MSRGLDERERNDETDHARHLRVAGGGDDVMTTVKDHQYQVTAATLPRGRVRLTADGKPSLEAAMPPFYRGGTPGMWTPEDLLVASVASCYAVTLESIADHHDVPLSHVEVAGVGHVTRRAEGRIGFVVIELAVDVTVPAGSEEQAERTANSAKQTCLVGHALEVPLELELRIHVKQPVEPLAAG